MRREDLKELHYITRISNVRSIMIRGIYSYHRASKVPHESFAMLEVQERRDAKLLARGKPLHSYANLYICAQNAALFKVQDGHEDLCVLRVKTDVLDLPGVVVCDRNAAASGARFLEGANGLSSIDPKIVFATSWKDRGDSKPEGYYKQAKCAEVLVPDRVPGRLVFGGYVSGERTRARLEALVSELQITVHPELFFLESRRW